MQILSFPPPPPCRARPRRAASVVSALCRLCAVALVAALLGSCVTANERWQSARGDVQVHVGDRLVAQYGFALVACRTETSTFQFWTGGSRKRCVQAGAASPAQAKRYAAGTVVRVVAIKDRGMVDAEDSLMLLKSEAWRGTVVANADLAQGLFLRQQ
jgi:hypothetical protein